MDLRVIHYLSLGFTSKESKSREIALPMTNSWLMSGWGPVLILCPSRFVASPFPVHPSGSCYAVFPWMSGEIVLISTEAFQEDTHYLIECRHTSFYRTSQILCFSPAENLWSYIVRWWIAFFSNKIFVIRNVPCVLEIMLWRTYWAAV